MASFASRVIRRYYYNSKIALKQHKQHKHKHHSIPPKIMNVNTCYKYPQFNRQGIQPQKYEYFLVLDFEATCEPDFALENQEIIEFPCLKVESKSFEVVDQFHEYIKPVENPTLSMFCVHLTGIIQDMVNNKPTFKDVFPRFLDWLSANNLQTYGDKANSIFVTCGDWDLKIMLPKQCEISNLSAPREMSEWINLKYAFHSSTGYFPRGIKDMALLLDIKHEGKLHSGIGDCSNIVKILKGLAERGFQYQKTSQLKNPKDVDDAKKHE